MEYGINHMYIFNRGIFWIFFLPPLWRWMLGSNPGLLRLRHWQSDALTTRLCVIRKARYHPQRLDLIHSVEWDKPHIHFLCQFPGIPDMASSKRWTRGSVHRSWSSQVSNFPLNVLCTMYMVYKKIHFNKKLWRIHERTSSVQEDSMCSTATGGLFQAADHINVTDTRQTDSVAIVQSV
jgi:hypothetical protein